MVLGGTGSPRDKRSSLPWSFPEEEEDDEAGWTLPSRGAALVPDPTFGTIAVAGKSLNMEDSIAVRLNLCFPEINRMQPIHFFAVYDGHGGSRVSALCREKMHKLVKEELLVEQLSQEDLANFKMKSEKPPLSEKWETALKKAFKRMDEEAMTTCLRVDNSNDKGHQALETSLCGSTAVIAVLTQEWIIVANCGDSRAVVGRGGMAFSVTDDHKPDRPDELARIEAAGGRVIHVNGPRVAGILAMSRSIGDRYLKPFVISEPEVTFTRRQAGDECLIIASDGLWDVVSASLACDVCRVCLGEPSMIPSDLPIKSRMGGEQAQNGPPSPATMAAALLARLALARNSLDNISVIVVDLKQNCRKIDREPTRLELQKLKQQPDSPE